MTNYRRPPRNEDLINLIIEFQYLEFSMKFCISCAYQASKILIKERIPFNFHSEDIQNHSLERLISSYRHFCNNQELLKKLNIAVKHRNEIVHKSFVLTDPILKNYHNNDGEVLISKIQEVKDNLELCLKGIHRETENFIRIIRSDFPTNA